MSSNQNLATHDLKCDNVIKSHPHSPDDEDYLSVHTYFFPKIKILIVADLVTTVQKTNTYDLKSSFLEL